MSGAETPPRVTVDDWEAAARERLPKMAYDYYRSGADEEHTLRRNRDAYARYALWYRTLVDVSEPVLETRVLGTRVAHPILVAPTAYHRMAHEDGELASGRRVEVGGGLVEHEQLGLHREHRRDRDPPTLPSRDRRPPSRTRAALHGRLRGPATSKSSVTSFAGCARSP
jgi:hypothetical protein